jgi:SAM-dependent methyltransferase
MKLDTIIHRKAIPKPWEEGEKIPWNEPGFSQRMLAEHLSQQHDAASRRAEIIDQHVEWIYNELLGGRPGHILDLGGGPGLYTSRLARRGCECVGIDFSPASIAYAREYAVSEGLSCIYQETDIRTADYGEDYDLAMLIYGEFNAFRPQEARQILAKIYQALYPKGRLLLEAHTYSTVQAVGRERPSWYSAEHGLFSDKPYLCLKECFWDAEQSVATERYYIIDPSGGEVKQISASLQAYSFAEYREMMEEAGFIEIMTHPSFGAAAPNPDFVVFTAVKQ